MSKFFYFDYEYFNTTHPSLHPVCVAYEGTNRNREVIWLHQGQNWELWKDILQSHIDDGYIFVPWNAQAEARASLPFGIEVTKMKWFDLFLEYKCLTNHYNNLMYGKQLNKDGKEIRTFAPTGYGSKKVSNAKPSHSLAAGIYKLLNVKIDTDHKNEMRDIIISGDAALIEANKEHIMQYCMDDVKYLPQLKDKILQTYSKLLHRHKEELKTLPSEIILRGEYGARTALMEESGYPFHQQKTKNLSVAIEDILGDVAKDINSQFPDIKPFRYDMKVERFKMNQNNVKKWIKEECPYGKDWLQTAARGPSLSIEEWTKHYDFKHNFPKGNFGAQMVRYLKNKQNLGGFRVPETRKPGTKIFWDYVGPDGRIRAYLNPFGSQSARTQPGSTGFIPLKTAWLRSLIEPKKGRTIGAIDYGSEEFLIAGLLANDDKMIEAYASGDVYLHFAKAIGMVPKDGTKKTHPDERQQCKSTVLGIQYDMTKVGLSKKLTNEVGRKFSEEEAQDLIDKFEATYWRYIEWRKQQVIEYRMKGFLKLPCGWYMWGDNWNDRSIGNCPTQGMGSSIMRKAVALAQDRGVEVIFTLHDALYLEADSHEALMKMKIMAESMHEAFVFYFPEKMKELAGMIRLDCEVWGPDWEEGSAHIEYKKGEGDYMKVKVATENIHVDERAGDEYEQYRSYFDIDDTLLGVV